jgi:SWI/SNF-related matrix-associated actin-dependent regulator of chromatin subfamily A-like protein 1
LRGEDVVNDKPVIRISPDGPAHVTLSPKSYLGGPLFGAYRRAIEGSTFDGARKVNRLTRDRLPAVVAALKAAGFAPVAPQELHDAVTGAIQQQTLDVGRAETRSVALAAKLAAEGHVLYPFQATGTAWLAPRFSALLADEQGLGKTIQTLTALPSGDDRRGVLVVCPAVAKGVWVRETRKWRSDLLPSVLRGRGSFRWPRPGELVVTNFDILPDMVPPLDESVVMVADECHALKNYEAARTKKFRALAQEVIARGGRVWGLTGTPLENTPPELWGVLQSLGLAQEAFGSWKQFAEIFQARKTKWGTEWGMPTAEAHTRLQRVMVRRLRREVLPELPVKTYDVVPCELMTKAERAIDEAYEAEGSLPLDVDELPSFERMSGTRAALAEAKIPTLLETIDAYDTEETPIVVMSAHRAPVAAVIEKMRGKSGKPWAEITGDTSANDRTRIQDEFQAGRLAGIVGTLQAMGVALTLTRAHTMIFLDRAWNPAKNAQAEDRICRIGQDRGCVIVDLVARHPLDEHIHAVLRRKQALIDATLLRVGVTDDEADQGQGTERVES